MYKITYKNGYIRYSRFKYGSYRTKTKPSDVLVSEEIEEKEKNENKQN